MGSFYATCSITNQTISDGQEMYMQFMLPSKYADKTNSGSLFVESFLGVVKSKGLDEAIKSWDEATKTWDSKLVEKGLNVSNRGACDEWVPFGPAIRGTYDDYGNIAPSLDEDSQKRVKILEDLMGGLPFSTIMDVAQDDRWYTLGLGKYKDNPNPNSNWRPEGISKDMPEWLLILSKNLSLTYFHASVYDIISDYNFAPRSKNCKLDKYDKKYKKEYFDVVKKSLPKAFKFIKNIGDEKTTFSLYEFSNSNSVFSNLGEELSLIYLACMSRDENNLEWFYETLSFMYSLTGMCLFLRRSNYGSQEGNWFAWLKINEALTPKILETIKKLGYEDDDKE
jgi:hypothetical protein